MQCGRPLLFLFIPLLAFAALRVQAQKTVASEQSGSPIFHHLDYTNGLLSNEVFSLAQDRKGYMWIGTRKGLQRYDGLRFINYADTSSTGREDLEIADIFPDEGHDRLLYNQFYSSLKAWKWLDHHPLSLLPSLEWKPDSAIAYRDEKGDDWLLQPYFISQQRQGRRITEGIALLKEPGKTASRFIFFIKDAERGETWLSDPSMGLFLLDDSHKRLSSPSGADAGTGTGAGTNALLQLVRENYTIVRKISMDSHDNIWLITWGHLFYRYNVVTRKLYTYSVSDIIRQQGVDLRSHGYVSSILEDNHGRLWIGTASAGLLEYHFEGDSFTYMLHQPGNDLSVQYNDQIFGLFQDREENIWVGTDKGISIFNPYRQYFTTMGNQQPYPGMTPKSEINCAEQNRRGDLLVGSWGNGISIYDAQGKLTKNFLFKDVHDKNLLWSFLNQEDGSVWAGCQHGYLHILDTANRLVRTLHPVELEGSTIRCMIRDDHGNVLLGLHNGKIITWDKRSGQFLSFNNLPPYPSFHLSSILNLYLDKEGRCWAGTMNGLVEFDREARCFHGVYKPPVDIPMPFNGITDYDDSTLLTGTANGGLYLFNRRSKQFYKLPFRTEELLWSAYAIRKDTAGNIWFATDYDICKYNPVEKKFLTYHPEKGVINSAFASTNFVLLRSGKWLTWTNTEIVLFSPGELSARQTDPAEVTITGINVFDKPLFIDSSLYLKKPVQLGYKENFIRIQYSLLHFSGIARTEYYYRLSGIDKDWVYAGSRGYANYTNLPPGHYRFQVKAGGSTGESNMASIELVIIPPFWETWWFRSLCFILLTGALYGFIRWRILRIRHDADIQQQMATTEMMALRAQMNPHFIFNCINGIDALIQSNDKYQATIYLNKFARLIRNILDSSRQNSIPLTKDLETLRLYVELELFRNSHKFTVEISADEEMLREDYKVPPLIVQPYVENAILHGLRNRSDDKGKLVIHVARQNGHLLYTVEDNGVGREASKKDQLHRSYGMEMTSERVKLFNKQKHAPVTVTDLQIDGEAAGTRVQILLKIP